jgi:hypothetical protein
VIGLRESERDAALPAEGGQADLVPPVGEEACALVREHLLDAGHGADVASATWEYARWKPGVSCTAVQAIELGDGTRRLVTFKRYRDDKARTLAGRLQADPRADGTAPLRSFARVPELGLVLSTFPADRILRGTPRLLDVRRTARRLEDAGWSPPRAIRKRWVAFELLRYKPERRAVFRLDLDLRRDEGGAARARLAARVLPPARAAGSAGARERLAAAGLGNALVAPRLVAADPDAGVLFESWLDAEVLAPDAFEHAVEAGRLLARLHALPASGVARSAADLDWDTLLVPVGGGELERPARALRAALEKRGPVSRPVWTHGDFHPDQIAVPRGSAALALLDLDDVALRPGAADLASWIADHLAARPQLDLFGAADPLLCGYEDAGGAAIDPAELSRATARALARLAAGAVRRLESGAVVRARGLIERALEVSR